MHRSIHRRSLLRAAGVAVALPMLETMTPAFARTAPPPRRSVFICNTLGLHPPSLFPKQAEAGYEDTEYLSLLAGHRDRYTLFSGLSHPDQNGKQPHDTEMTWLTAARNPGMDGFRNTLSIDQNLATRLGNITRFPSISLSSDGPSSQSYSGGGVMIPADHSPASLFAKLFLQGKPAEIELQRRQLREGGSILDTLSDQARKLGSRVSVGDRQRLDEYYESLRAAEVELTDSGAWLDRPKPQVDAPQPADIAQRADLVGRTRSLMNLIPLILQTDSTRVMSLVIQDHQVVPTIEGVEAEHHNLSHHGQDPAKIEQLKRIETSLLTCFREMLDGLHTRQEEGGTLLDSTAVLLGSNLGNANAHDPRNLPILLAGGGFRHGTYVSHKADDNTPLSNLFVRMMNAMDLPTDSFGTSTGELTW